MGRANDEIVLQLDRVEDLFVAPDVDPCSENEAAVLGEPALEHVAKRFGRRFRFHQHPSLTLILPNDRITPDLAPRVQAAIRRYCAARIDENDLAIRTSTPATGRMVRQ